MELVCRSRSLKSENDEFDHPVTHAYLPVVDVHETDQTRILSVQLSLLKSDSFIEPNGDHRVVLTLARSALTFFNAIKILCAEIQYMMPNMSPSTLNEASERSTRAFWPSRRSIRTRKRRMKQRIVDFRMRPREHPQ